MDKKQIQSALALLKKNAPKRNFKQSIDLIINLKDLDLKKPDNKVDQYAQLHYDRGKKVAICGLVGAELMANAKNSFDTAILSDDFSKYSSDKKKLKKLAESHQFFVAQANIMPLVASTFGKVLGTRGKMPNPKAGCVVPPNANLAPLVEKLKKTVRVKVDTTPVFQTSIGIEDSNEEEIIDNALTIYNTLLHALPNEIHNIKEVYLKFTMSAPIKVGQEEKEAGKQQKKALKEKTQPAKEAAEE